MGRTVLNTRRERVFDRRRCCGPVGLLNLIESQLGLSGPGVPAALRIAQYLSRLRAIDDGEMFFSASLATDGWATARLLLSWRDELTAANWSPGSVSWESERFACIALAEAQEDRPLALGIPDRVRATVPRIRSASPIYELTLVDDPECLPLVWRHLIEALDTGGTNYRPRHRGAGQTDQRSRRGTSLAFGSKAG